MFKNWTELLRVDKYLSTTKAELSACQTSNLAFNVPVMLVITSWLPPTRNGFKPVNFQLDNLLQIINWRVSKLARVVKALPP